MPMGMTISMGFSIGCVGWMVGVKREFSHDARVKFGIIKDPFAAFAAERHWLWPGVAIWRAIFYRDSWRMGRVAFRPASVFDHRSRNRSKDSPALCFIPLPNNDHTSRNKAHGEAAIDPSGSAAENCENFRMKPHIKLRLEVSFFLLNLNFLRR